MEQRLDDGRHGGGLSTTAPNLKMTKAFVRRIPMTIMSLTKFTPYPGSPVYRELYGTAIRDDHWEKMNGMNFVWAPDGLGVEELDRHYPEVIWLDEEGRSQGHFDVHDYISMCDAHYDAIGMPQGYVKTLFR